MKDLRFRQLEKHRVSGTRDRMQLSLPVPKSRSGKMYQYSPNPDATVSGVSVPLRFAVLDLRLIGDFSSEVSEGFWNGGWRGRICRALRGCRASSEEPALA
jgi:hypothetical protein